MGEYTLLALHLHDPTVNVTNNAPGAGTTTSAYGDEPDGEREDDAGGGSDDDAAAAGGPDLRRLVFGVALVAALVALARALGREDEALDELAALDEETA